MQACESQRSRVCPAEILGLSARRPLKLLALLAMCIASVVQGPRAEASDVGIVWDSVARGEATERLAQWGWGHAIQSSADDWMFVATKRSPTEVLLGAACPGRKVAALSDVLSVEIEEGWQIAVGEVVVGQDPRPLAFGLSAVKGTARRSDDALTPILFIMIGPIQDVSEWTLPEAGIALPVCIGSGEAIAVIASTLQAALTSPSTDPDCMPACFCECDARWEQELRTGSVALTACLSGCVGAATVQCLWQCLPAAAGGPVAYAACLVTCAIASGAVTTIYCGKLCFAAWAVIEGSCFVKWGACNSCCQAVGVPCP